TLSAEIRVEVSSRGTSCWLAAFIAGLLHSSVLGAGSRHALPCDNTTSMAKFPPNATSATAQKKGRRFDRRPDELLPSGGRPAGVLSRRRSRSAIDDRHTSVLGFPNAVRRRNQIIVLAPPGDFDLIVRDTHTDHLVLHGHRTA